MSETKWAPGPLTWLEADDWQEAAERGQCFTLADADNNDIADIYHNNHATVPTTPEQAAAYARLFAAAPALYAMLAELTAQYGDFAGEPYQMPPDTSIARARAVLASARGES